MSLEYSRMKELLKLRTTKVVDYACQLLESRGLRFCVDFGTKNAVSKATELVTGEMEEAERNG